MQILWLLCDCKGDRPDSEHGVPSETQASFFDENVPKWVKVDGIDSYPINVLN